jgi:adenosylcobinamide amidohydrolase
MEWEVLSRRTTNVVRRRGRFLVVDLLTPHRTLSTSARNGGQAEHVRHLLNHQSCEGKAHAERTRLIHERGPEAYHDAICAEAGVPESATSTMGTAASMNYAALVTEGDADVEVTAVVTAGVQTNATCAGDPAAWRETTEGVVAVSPVEGTINTMLVVSRPLTVAALARLAINATEGKSAALQQLAVPSCYSADLATGTGTDQYCLAAPLDGAPLTTASPHVKFGEIAGLAVRRATLEALRWQNGLEPGLTRSVFHALGRFGVRDDTIFEDLATHLEQADLELLRQNSRAVFYEPLVGAAAYALAAVLDRARHGVLPDSVLSDAAVQQAAMLAANLAAQPHRWFEFRMRLLARGAFTPRSLVLAAIALGWSEKWRSS